MGGGKDEANYSVRPKISAIVPVYNVKPYLEKCLNSILSQSLSDFEVLVIDDGSTDGSSEVCDRYASLDNRVKVIHKENEGLGLARNTGIAHASGTYVWFIDSDDSLPQDAFDVMYRQADEHNAEICFGGIAAVYRGGLRKEQPPLYGDRLFDEDEIVDIVLKDMLGSWPKCSVDYVVRMSAWQGLYSLDWLREHGLSFPSEREFISEDIIFHLKALPCCRRMKYVEACVYDHYCDNRTSLTHEYRADRFEKYVTLYKKETEMIKHLGLSDEYVQRAQRTFLGNTRVCIKQAVENASNPLLEISNILDSDQLDEVLSSYPIGDNPLRQRLLSIAMKHKASIIVLLMTKLMVIRQR